MHQRNMFLATCAFVATVATAVQGDILQVEVIGVVEYNQVTFGAFDAVDPGDDASFSFLIDSDVFTDSPNFPTRGYDIDQSSFSLVMGDVAVGLQDPFPGGQTPYFVLRNDDPAVDGFFVSTNVDFPVGVPLDEPGLFGQFLNNYSVTYDGDTLTSLDVLDAVGTYTFDGLTVFHWTVDDDGFEPIGLIFEQMTITVIPAPASWGALVAVGFLRTRRRSA